MCVYVVHEQIVITPIIIGHGVNVHFVYHVKTIPVHVEKLI